MLTEWKPTSRIHSTTCWVISNGWMRWTAFCTTGSSSCTPIEPRLKPTSRKATRWSRVSRRGSTSTPASTSGASVNREWIMSPSRRISSGSEKVGVPPPKWSWTTLRFGFSSGFIKSISRSRYFRYSPLFFWSAVITVVQPQNQQSE